MRLPATTAVPAAIPTVSSSGTELMRAVGGRVSAGGGWPTVVARCRFYHADPHPGNILRMRDGRLCYLDFGMMGSIDRATRQALIRATLHMVNREFEELASDFVTLGLLPEDSDATVEEVTASLQGAPPAARRPSPMPLPSGLPRVPPAQVVLHGSCLGTL